MAPPRHLDLVSDVLEYATPRIAWPVPFANGIPKLKSLRGQKVAVLASGDPFWFGAGSVLARHLEPHEWRALPGPSTFTLAAARLGWPMERITCMGLHAAPLDRLRRHIGPGERIITFLTGADAVKSLGEWLTTRGFGASPVHIMEALGGPRERITETRADRIDAKGLRSPLCVAFRVAGGGASLQTSAGRPDDLFENDGQLTKRPIRALTLSALAPVPGARLWDIGGGSGSVSIEWCLSHPHASTVTIERDPERAARIRRNARAFGVEHRLGILETDALSALDTPELWGDAPRSVFVGGGLSGDLLEALSNRLQKGTRIVANSVTLETESLLTDWQARLGGDLMRIDLAQMEPLGTRRGWTPSRPIVQWSATL